MEVRDAHIFKNPDKVVKEPVTEADLNHVHRYYDLKLKPGRVYQRVNNRGSIVFITVLAAEIDTRGQVKYRVATPSHGVIIVSETEVNLSGWHLVGE